jgi:hypothetical protein
MRELAQAPLYGHKLVFNPPRGARAVAAPSGRRALRAHASSGTLACGCGKRRRPETSTTSPPASTSYTSCAPAARLPLRPTCRNLRRAVAAMMPYPPARLLTTPSVRLFTSVLLTVALRRSLDVPRECLHLTDGIDLRRRLRGRHRHHWASRLPISFEQEAGSLRRVPEPLGPDTAEPPMRVCQQWGLRHVPQPLVA